MVSVTLRPPSDWTLVGSMLKEVRAVLEWDVLRRSKSTVVFQPAGHLKTRQTQHHTKDTLKLLHSHTSGHFPHIPLTPHRTDNGSLVNIHYVIILSCS